MEASEAEPPALNAAQCLERARAVHEPHPAPPRPAPAEAPESAEAAPSSVAPSSAVGDTHGPIRRISCNLSPRDGGRKRDASQEPEDTREAARARIHSTESLFCHEVMQCDVLHCSHVEQLMASFLQKRAQKEIPAQHNPPELQSRVDDAKLTEWETVSGKQAVPVWVGGWQAGR